MSANGNHGRANGSPQVNQTVVDAFNQRMHNQTVVDVRASVSRASGVVDPVDVLARRVHHDVDACEVIAAELVACTLGQRVRPELMVNTL